MSHQELVVQFRDLFSVSNFFYKLIGVPPLFPNAHPSRLSRLFFWTSFWNLFITYIAEGIFLVSASGSSNSFLQVIALVPCMCYVTLAVNGMIVIIFHRERIVKIIAMLEQHFPTTLQEQQAHKIMAKKRQFNLFFSAYTTVFVALIMTFNCVPFAMTLRNYLTAGVWEKTLPYFVWYPFNEYDDRVFPYVYALQSWAGFTCVFAMTAEIFLISASVMQFCIQFDRLAKAIREYRPDIRTDNKFLREAILRHNYILTHAQEFADIISASLFIHQTCSSLVICCVVLQVVIGKDVPTIIKFLQFAVSSLMQSIVVSYFGDQIMEYVRVSS